ncbi:unnamed protein product [Scytosiphon promiscuus]
MRSYGGEGGERDVQPDTSGLYHGTFPLMHAAYLKRHAMLAAILAALKRTKRLDVQLRAKDIRGRTVLQIAALGWDELILKAVLDAGESQGLQAEARSLEKDEAFSLCVRNILDTRTAGSRAFKTLSSLMAYSARPSARELTDLIRVSERRDSFHLCCLRAVTSAANPFVPGLTLSIRLGEAASNGSEGERRAITAIQSCVDDLLLEIFDRLPQTVRGFGAENMCPGMCAKLFEPCRAFDVGLPADPLAMIVSEEQQSMTFLKVPLVMDFLTTKFTLGLPDLNDTDCLLKTAVRVGDLDTSEFIRWYWSFRAGQILLGIGVPSLTFLPGAQFIAAAVVADPAQCYRIPAMRMWLDLSVYTAMVSALSFFVLFHNTTGYMLGRDVNLDERFRFPEAAFALIFTTAGLYREGREMKLDTRMYFKDYWNILDVMGLLFLVVGTVIRWSDWASPWGPAFYAFSTPLVVCRFLYFFQILPFQEAMIPVIIRVMSTITQFGIVMLVVMTGFAMALHVLFRDIDSYAETALHLFKAMLGDTDYFTEFSGGRYDPAATILVILYLFIVNVMLLNILVALFTTTVPDEELKASKARIVLRYKMVVDLELLPAPFNLLQLFLSLPVFLVTFLYGLASAEKPPPGASGRSVWSSACEKAGAQQARVEQAVGVVVFWLVSGSLAVVGGALLWVLSGFFSAPFVSYTHAAQFRSYTRARYAVKRTARRAIASCVPFDINRNVLIAFERSVDCSLVVVLTCLFVPLWCILIAPCWLFIRWLVPFGRRLPLLPRMNPADVFPLVVDEMLKNAPGGVGAKELLRFLEDPMTDGEVRRGDEEKTTTVEHIKLLRNHLEQTISSELERLRDDVASKDDVQAMGKWLEQSVVALAQELKK